MAGADPSFTGTHMLRALFILDSGPVGRKRLVKLLGVGEGSVRTIIKRLSADGLIKSGKLGHTLTARGKSKVDEHMRRLSKPFPVECRGLVPGGVSSAVVVRNASGRVGGVVALRDVALRAGADGAVILVYDGVLRFPGSGMDLSEYPGVLEELGELGMSAGDVVVVGFASDGRKAEDGALAVALKLL